MDGDRVKDGVAIPPAGEEPDRTLSRPTPPAQAPAPPPQAPAPAPPRKRLLPFVIFGLLLLAGAAGGGYEWLITRDFETTDDAFIDAHVSQISTQVAGRVIAVPVEDNVAVQQGDRLVAIDPSDYQVKLDQAEASRAGAAAQLEQASAQAALQRANLDQAEANVQVTEADLFQTQQDFDRYRTIDPRAISKQQLDNASAALRSAKARLEANRHAVAAMRAQVASADAQIDAARATLREQDAAVANARLQLSYTTINAPVAGRVAKRAVDVGNYVAPGTALMAIVPQTVYVTANFKETQLTRMRPGQPVEISIDAYPALRFRGRVDSIQPGTGSAFSLLPAENATGNYVKVVQRVPVKIVFDDPRISDYPLAPGMSVLPRVRVR